MKLKNTSDYKWMNEKTPVIVDLRHINHIIMLGSAFYIYNKTFISKDASDNPKIRK